MCARSCQVSQGQGPRGVAGSLASCEHLRRSGLGSRGLSSGNLSPAGPVLQSWRWGPRPRAGGTGQQLEICNSGLGEPLQKQEADALGVAAGLLKAVGGQGDGPAKISGKPLHPGCRWEEGGGSGARRLVLTAPPPALGCERDRLSFGFCETLRLLGRCQLPTVRTQCCRSCPPPGRGAPSRGRQRVARR